jgi:hypothetical protein
MRLRHLFLAALVGGLLFGVTLVPSAFAVGSYTTVVTGLDNPRDLDFSPNGKLYVAEAGSGGDPSLCITGDEGAVCPGFTSGLSVVDIAGGTSQRVVSGLASRADEQGFAATGLDGISFLGNGTLFGIMAANRDEVADAGFPADITAGLTAQLGQLIKFNPSGHWKTVADVGHFDFQWSADHVDLVPDQFPESNPYAVFATGGARWVADAASNTIDLVRPNGDVSVEAFIPNPPVSDAVPTCLDRGPDGALYIGQLTGVGNPPGSASIWRFAPGEATPLTKWATGLTAVTGCGFGADGQFYATEFSTLGFESFAPGTGEVVRVPPHSTSPTTVVDGLSFPGGFAAGADGSLYVSNWSIAPAVTGLGAVVRITP